jgi:hypothetical protein
MFAVGSIMEEGKETVNFALKGSVIGAHSGGAENFAMSQICQRGSRSYEPSNMGLRAN